MASITIRNLDSRVVEALKKRAKNNNRSLEAELWEILSSIANDNAQSTLPSADLIALARRISAMTPDVPQSDSTETLKEDR
ncbi:MAG: hypothetical protein AAF530_24475 [Pseudomonadota bacterium]